MSKFLIDRVVMSKPNQPEYGMMGSYHEVPTTDDNTDLVYLFNNWPSPEDYYYPFMVDTDQDNLKYVYKIIKIQRVANRNIYTLERKEVQHMLFGVTNIIENSRVYMMIYDFPGIDQRLPSAPDMSNYDLDPFEIEECDPFNL